VRRFSFLDPLGTIHRGLRRRLQENRHLLRGRLLDLGCGDRPYEQLARDAGATWQVAVDRLEVSPRIAADASSLPFLDGTFDAVLMTEVLEHVPEPGRVLREVSRVLSPSGALVLTTPWAWPLHEEPRDFYRFTPWGLRYLLASAGFQNVRVEKSGGLLAAAGQRVATALLYGAGLGRSRTGEVALAPLAGLLQAAGELLDRAAGSRGEPLNYVAVGRKGAGP
jgi:SAM-dependent methyltransferase